MRYFRDPDLAFAHRLADEAAAVSVAMANTRPLKQWRKPDGSLVTEADLAVEDAIRALLDAERSADAVLGEERGLTGTGSRRWVIDGIDGTTDFAAGSPDWGTLIALEVDGDVAVAVCDFPAHARRYWATKGGGAFRSTNGRHADSERLRVSDERELGVARSYVPRLERLVSEASRAIGNAIARGTQPQAHTDHPALQVSWGGYEVAVFATAGPWDLAAPLLVVEEAGGRFTDFGGSRDWTTGTAVFSNGHVHDEVLRVMADATLS